MKSNQTIFSTENSLTRSLLTIKETIKFLIVFFIHQFLSRFLYKIKSIINHSLLGLILNYQLKSHQVLSNIPLSTDIDYYRWLIKNYPRKSDLNTIAEIAINLKYQPLISVIIAVCNTPELFLRRAIESAIEQTYPYWELCIADDASEREYIKSILEEYQAIDNRIKVTYRKTKGNLSLCLNTALELATGEFIALLDQNDLLTPDALYQVAIALNNNPDADMLYSDEDKIDRQARLSSPFFKPDWCPDSFLSRMYTCHLGIYRRELVNQIGGFRIGYEGSQDYDLVLRLTEKTDKIVHIPKILYHWRLENKSPAKTFDDKNDALKAAHKAITDALHRRNEKADIITTYNGHHLIRYHIADYKKVSIIIPTRNLGKILNTCLISIFEKTEYPNYEVLVIDNDSTEKETQDVLDYWLNKEPKRFRTEVLDIPFNFSIINNYAVKQTDGEYLLFLNNDIEVINNDWLNAMVEQAQRLSIGAVGALLLYSDNSIQHAGVIAGLGGVAGHSHKHYSVNSPGYFDQIHTINNYAAVTGACLMCRRKVFDEIGGFEEKLSIAFNDVDLCFKILEKGYRNIYLPHAKLYHYESKSRGYEITYEKQQRFVQEIKFMVAKWNKYIEKDSCYSPHLSKKYEDYSLNKY